MHLVYPIGMSNESPAQAPDWAGVSESEQRRFFEQQALPHLNDLRAAARRYGSTAREDPDDLVQDTLLRALVGWQHFRPGTDCRAWLLRILANSYISGYRRRSRERRILQENGPFLCVDQHRATRHPESLVIDAMQAAQIAAAVHRLPTDFAEVLVMADLKGLRYREIAGHLGCPIGTVMSRLHRARRQIAAELQLDDAPVTSNKAEAAA